MSLRWTERRRSQAGILAVTAGLLCVAAASAGQGGARQSSPGEDAFNDVVAVRLLNQIGDAMASGNQKKLLATFDLGRMTGGSLYRQQIASFFAETTNIRAHFNLVETTMQDGSGVATVDVEMEADRREDGMPPLHKQAQLRFVAEKTGAGWKFTDVQPRSFFSTSQP